MGYLEISAGMKMMRKNEKYVFITAGLIVLIVASAGNVIMSTSLIFYWHVTNDSRIIDNKYEIHLPFNWWVFSKTKQRANLARIPSIGEEYFANVFIADELLTKEELNKFPIKKITKGELLIREKNIDSLVIDNQLAFSVEYAAYKYENNKEKIYVTWTVPARNIVISGIDIDVKQRNFIKTDIIDNIKFR